MEGFLLPNTICGRYIFSIESPIPGWNFFHIRIVCSKQGSKAALAGRKMFFVLIPYVGNIFICLKTPIPGRKFFTSQKSTKEIAVKPTQMVEQFLLPNFHIFVEIYMFCIETPISGWNFFHIRIVNSKKGPQAALAGREMFVPKLLY